MVLVEPGTTVSADDRGREYQEVGEAISWSTPILRDAGIDTARLDSQLLLAWALKSCREDLAREPQRRLTARERLVFEKAVALRAARRPQGHSGPRPG